MSFRFRRVNWPVFAFYAIIVAAIGGYAALATAFEVWGADEQFRSRISDGFFNPGLNIVLWDNFAEAMFGAWFFLLGATIGSFLNVVAYRIPIGRTIVFEGSSCPYCRVPIRSSDNVPILGWLRLRGRCRSCRLPISSRYPIVEFTCGAIFLALYDAELLWQGNNFPLYHRAIGLEISRIIIDLRFDVLAIYCFHGYLLAAMLAASLMDYDRKVPPRSYWEFIQVFGFGSVLVWPFLLPLLANLSPSPLLPLWTRWLATIPWWTGVAQQGTGSLVADIAVTASVGLVVGATLGLGLQKLVVTLDNANPRSEDGAGPSMSTSRLIGAMGGVGIFLGWQSALAIFVIFLVCYGLALLWLKSQQKRVVPLMVLIAASLIWFSVWKLAIQAII